MNISNAHITNSIFRFFIYNQYILSIWNMTMLPSMYDEVYDPNKLYSSYIIKQSGTQPKLFMSGNNFIGAYRGVFAISGSVTIINCSFQQMRSNRCYILMDLLCEILK